MEEEDEIIAIVIDNGTGFIKAGFTGEDDPKSVFPPIISPPKRVKKEIFDSNHAFRGEEAISKVGVFRERYPLEQGVVTNWDDMEKIWHKTFYTELRVAPEEHPVFVTEPPMNPKANRERMAQIMFETFNVPAFYTTVQAVLALYASGRLSGVVLDSGDSVTHALAVSEGYLIPHTVNRVEVCGKDVSDYLMKLLIEKGYSTDIDVNVVNKIKEELCIVANDFDDQLNEILASPESHQKIFELQNKKLISLTSERIMCPEIFFKPEMIGKEGEGIHRVLYKTIMQSGRELDRSLFTSILICGGSTMFEGFAERLEKEMVALAPATQVVKIIAPPERNISVWKGGSILASLSTFQQMWISKEDYDECGPGIVHSKCK